MDRPAHARPSTTGGPPARGRRSHRTLRERLVLAGTVLLTLVVGAAPAVAQSVSDGVPVDVVGPRATVLSADADGRIVEAFGDVRHARNIAVIVPGVGWNAALLRDEQGAGRRHPAVQARSLLAEMQRLSPHTPAAVVVWLDYDPPAGIDPDAARSDRAVDGAPRLVSFVGSLPLSARVSVVCHSYGSVVCGHAAPRLRVTDLVAVGSPGMDAWSRTALRTRAEVWAGIAPDDPIALVPHTRVDGFGHAADPTSPAFGAQTLPVGGAHGHNGYLVAGTDSLRAIAQLATGGRPS